MSSQHPRPAPTEDQARSSEYAVSPAASTQQRSKQSKAGASSSNPTASKDSVRDSAAPMPAEQRDLNEPAGVSPSTATRRRPSSPSTPHFPSDTDPHYRYTSLPLPTAPAPPRGPSSLISIPASIPTSWIVASSALLGFALLVLPALLPPLPTPPFELLLVPIVVMLMLVVAAQAPGFGRGEGP